MDNQPVWIPKHPKTTRMWAFMRFVSEKHQKPMSNYPDLYAWSIENLSLFWQDLSDFFKLPFHQSSHDALNHYDRMIDAKWFSHARFNFAETLLSRNDDHPALISINEHGDKEILSYHTLRQRVISCAQGLRHAGIKEGDRVAGVLPNGAMPIIAMLATTSLGAIWSSCSPDFGAEALIDRLGQIEPKLLFFCDGHYYSGKTYEAKHKMEQVVAAIPSIKHVVICPIIHHEPTLPGEATYQHWDDFLIPTEEFGFKPMPFAQPIYILFSSGTTGKPKCIVHGAGGTLLQHLKELGLHTDIREPDNLCFYTTCGWMMWNWMVSTLALGATLTLYDGDPMYPDPSRMFRLINDESVTVFGTSAKFISSAEKTGFIPKNHLPMKRLRTILSTGSPLLSHHYDFVYSAVKPDVQLSSISGGTDIVSCFALGNPLLPVFRGELQSIGLGMAVDIYDEDGFPVLGKAGELVCTKPFPSMPVGFWHDNHNRAYEQAYFNRFPNVWAHGDFAELTPHHGLIIHGRSDAVLNPGGVRIGTAEIYRHLETIPEILESVAIGQNWHDDVRIVLFVKLRDGLTLNKRLTDTIGQTLRNHASPRHVPAKILQVNSIPRTLSGKVVELAVKQAVHGQPITNLQSLANPEALEQFKNRAELRD